MVMGSGTTVYSAILERVAIEVNLLRPGLPGVCSSGLLGHAV